MSEASSKGHGRRQFIGGAAAATGVMILRPEVAFGSQANSAVQLGLVGCGGRGTGVTSSFLEHTGAVVTAIGDVFQDRLDWARETLDEASEKHGKPAIDPGRVFRGIGAYEEVAGSDAVDAVYVATPAWFHPMHAEAVVAANKHLYLEKPVGVDVAGCKKVMELGKQAAGKISFAVGFQIRKASPYVELVERVHNGQIGLPITGQIHYFASALNRPDTPNASPVERRLRNWVWDRELSGDIIVEQNVHIIDVTNWVLDAHPVKAVGSGGRLGRLDDGDCWSHFNLVYTYPGGASISFGSTQFGSAAWGVAMQYYGSHGFAEAHYDAPVRIEGENPWEFPGLGQTQESQEDAVTGNFSGALDDADPNKQKSFIESITSGKFLAETQQGAEAALSGILGREAAYTGREIEWYELLASNQEYDPGIDWSPFA